MQTSRGHTMARGEAVTSPPGTVWRRATQAACGVCERAAGRAADLTRSAPCAELHQVAEVTRARDACGHITDERRARKSRLTFDLISTLLVTAVIFSSA